MRHFMRHGNAFAGLSTLLMIVGGKITAGTYLVVQVRICTKVVCEVFAIRGPSIKTGHPAHAAAAACFCSCLAVDCCTTVQRVSCSDVGTLCDATDAWAPANKT